MSIFKKIVSGAQEPTGTVGNESANVASDDAKLLVLSAQVATAEAEVAQQDLEGQQIEFEMAALDEGTARIDDALAAIAGSSIGLNAAPSLSTETLAMLDATLLRDFGVKATGLESSSSLGPVEATEEIVLGLESLAGDAWKSTVETFYKFLDWVAKQLNSIFGGLEKLKSRAKALKAKEESFDGSVSKDKVKVDLGLLVEGKAGESIGDLAKGIEELGQASSLACDAIETSASEVVDEIDKALDQAADKWDGDEPEALKATSAKYKALHAKIAALADGSAILGGRNVKALSAEAEKPTGASKLKLELEAPVKKKDSKEVAPLDRSKITEVCDAVMEACEEMINGRKKMADTKAFKSKFEKLSKAAEKLVKDSDYKTHAGKIRTTGKLATACGFHANGQIRTKLTAHTQRVMGAALSYAEKSLKKA